MLASYAFWRLGIELEWGNQKREQREQEVNKINMMTNETKINSRGH